MAEDALEDQSHIFLRHLLQPSFYSCTCICLLWLTVSFLSVLIISYIPFPDTQFFIIFLCFLPLLNLFFLSHFKSLEAPSLYLQMTSGSGRLCCDWSPVPAVAVSAPEAFVHLPSLRSFLAGPMVPPSASLCMPCWALKTARWAVLGFLRCWIDCGGQWLGWVVWLKYRRLILSMAVNEDILKRV